MPESAASWGRRFVRGYRLLGLPAGSRATSGWRIRAEKGVLRRFSFVMKPLFAANHRWAMARGEESLRLEIARRHAHDDPAVLAAIPQLPGPTFPQNLRRRRVEARCAHAADPVPRA